MKNESIYKWVLTVLGVIVLTVAGFLTNKVLTNESKINKVDNRQNTDSLTFEIVKNIEDDIQDDRRIQRKRHDSTMFSINATNVRMDKFAANQNILIDRSITLTDLEAQFMKDNNYRSQPIQIDTVYVMADDDFMFN